MSEILNIGERIRDARKNKGLTSKKMAEMIGMSNQVVSHWENGRRVPTLESIIALSEVLDVTTSYLLCINEDSDAPKFKSIPLHEIENFSSESALDEIAVPTKMLGNLNEENLIAVILADNSMENLFRKGDIVIANKNKHPYDRALVLIQINKTKQILLRQYTINNSDAKNPQISFIASNNNYEEIRYDSSSISILGVCEDNTRLSC